MTSTSISRQDAIASQERYLAEIRNDPLGIDPVMIALAERKLAQLRGDAPPAPASREI